MSERLTKKQLKEDPFLEAIQSALAYARDNILIVVGGGIVFVLAIMLAAKVGGSATGRSAKGNPQAERALADAQAEFALGRMDEGIVALDGVKTEHGGSQAAREATYALAAAHFEAGNWASAQEAFEEFLREPLYDDLLQDGARFGIGACREESGDLSGALAAYEEIWNTGSNAGTRIQGALAAARVARAQGQIEQARRFYEAIVDRHPDAPEAETARFEMMGLGRG